MLKKILKWSLIIFCPILLITAGGLSYLLTREPSPPVPPPTISLQAAERLKDKLTSLHQEIESAKEAGESKLVRIEITEEEVNSLIAQELPQLQDQIPLKVQSAHVYFREGKIKVIAKIDIPGINPTVSADFDPQALSSEENIKNALTDLKFGKLPIPAGVKENVRHALGEKLSELELPIKLEEIKVDEGKFFIKGVAKTS